MLGRYENKDTINIFYEYSYKFRIRLINKFDSKTV